MQEDLDLVAYSVMPTFQAPQGVPLKAVYQGAVVGLRYQHPRVAPPGQAPVSSHLNIQLGAHASNMMCIAIQTVPSNVSGRRCCERFRRTNPLRVPVQGERGSSCSTRPASYADTSTTTTTNSFSGNDAYSHA